MEKYNPTGKSLSELIKEFEPKGIQIILIGEDAGVSAQAEIGAHIALIERMKMQDAVVLVSIADLPNEDQRKIQEQLAIEKLCKPLDPEMFKLTAPPKLESLPDKLLSADNKLWFEKFPKKRNKKSYRK